jgi:hypothetical protein
VFLAARAAKAGWDVRERASLQEYRVYASTRRSKHTWLQKAAI